MSTTRETTVDRIVVRCDTCGARRSVRNSGLNRAAVATWETRHQHPPTTHAREPETTDDSTDEESA